MMHIPHLPKAFVAVVLASGLTLAASACGSDDDTSTDTTNPSGVELPQNPSLRIFVEAETVYVENDGNVTMSDVEVREESGDVLCDLGTLSPDDRQPCAEAAGEDGVTAFGVGPQDQEVEVGLAE